jgi:bacterial/archaeal transporter family protein
VNWVTYALLGALAAGVTSVLSKFGVGNVPSNLAVLIRTVVVIVIAAAIVFVRGEQSAVKDVKPGAWLALILSGAATGVSWLAYFKALQLAPVTAVAPVDKLSLAVSVLLASLFLGEVLTWKVVVGVALMIAGAILATRP